MQERLGAAFEFDEQLTVLGHRREAGDPAPEFALDTYDPTIGTVRLVRLSDSAGTVRLLSVVNSLDTPVCHVGTRRWEQLRVDLPPDVTVYTVSMDLPFAQARWQTAENIGHTALSAHRDEAFGRDYGVFLKEWRLLQRAVFVVDRGDRIAYAEYVADQMHEPDYDAAISAICRAAAS